MYTGKMIDELMKSVERAEQHAQQLHTAEDLAVVHADVRQIRDTFIYNFSYSREHIGVA